MHWSFPVVIFICNAQYVCRPHLRGLSFPGHAQQQSPPIGPGVHPTPPGHNVPAVHPTGHNVPGVHPTPPGHNVPRAHLPGVHPPGHNIPGAHPTPPGPNVHVPGIHLPGHNVLGVHPTPPGPNVHVPGIHLPGHNVLGVHPTPPGHNIPGALPPSIGHTVPGHLPSPSMPKETGVPGYPIHPRPVLTQGSPTEGPPAVNPVSTHQQPQPVTSQPAAVGHLSGFPSHQVQMPVPGQNVLSGYHGYGQGATITPQPRAQPVPGMDPLAVYQQQPMGMGSGFPLPGSPEFQQLPAGQQSAIFGQMYQQMVMQQSQMWYFMQQQQQQLQQFTMTQQQPQSFPQASMAGEMESMEVEPEKGPGKASEDKDIEAELQQASTETVGLNLNLTEDNPENPDTEDTPDKDFDILQSGEESFIILSQEGSMVEDLKPGLGDTAGLRPHSPLETTTQAVAVDTSELETQTNQTSQDTVGTVASGSQQGSRETHHPIEESLQVPSTDANDKDGKVMNTADTQPEMGGGDASEKDAALNSTCSVSPGTHDAAMGYTKPETRPDQASLDRTGMDSASGQESGEGHSPPEGISSLHSITITTKEHKECKVTAAPGPPEETGDGISKENDDGVHQAVSMVSPEAAAGGDQTEQLPDHDDADTMDTSNTGDTGAEDLKESMPPIVKPNGKLLLQDHDEKDDGKDSPDKKRKRLEDHTAEEQIHSGATNFSGAKDKLSTKPKLDTEAQTTQTSYTGDTTSTEENSLDHLLTGAGGKLTAENSSDRDGKTQSSDSAEVGAHQTSLGEGGSASPEAGGTLDKDLESKSTLQSFVLSHDESIMENSKQGTGLSSVDMDTTEPETRTNQHSLDRDGAVDSASGQDSGESRSTPEGGSQPSAAMTTKDDKAVTTANLQQEIADGDAKEKDAATCQSVTAGEAAAAQKQALPDANSACDTKVGNVNVSAPTMMKSDAASFSTESQKSTKLTLNTEEQTPETSSAGASSTKEGSSDNKSPCGESISTAENSSQHAQRDGKTQFSEPAEEAGVNNMDDKIGDAGSSVDASAASEKSTKSNLKTEEPTQQTSSAGDTASTKEGSSDDKLSSAESISTAENSPERDGTTPSIKVLPGGNVDDKIDDPGSSVDAVDDAPTAEAGKQEALTKKMPKSTEAGEKANSIQETDNQDGRGAEVTSSGLGETSGDGHPEGLVVGPGMPHDSYMKEGKKALKDPETSGVRTQRACGISVYLKGYSVQLQYVHMVGA